MSLGLVSLRDRRERVLQLLTESFVADLLTLEEFDERTARAHAAEDLRELDALVSDLAPVASSQPVSSIDRAPAPEPKRMRTVFGNLGRRGDWIVPARFSVSAVFANAVLDFREARLTAAITEIDARVVCANLELIVPPELAVDCDGQAVFGNLENHATHEAASDRPILRVHGPIVFGNLEVHTRLPGESAREAYRRRKRERALDAARVRTALPARSVE